MFTIDDSHILFTEPNQTFEHMSFWRPYMITRHAKCSCPIKEKITMKGACLVPYYTLLIVLMVCPLHCRFRDFLHNNFRKLHTGSRSMTKFRFGCSTVSHALTIVRTYYPKYLAGWLIRSFKDLVSNASKIISHSSLSLLTAQALRWT